MKVGDVRIPELLPLITPLAACYDLHTDTFKLVYNGCPMNIRVQVKDYNDACDQINKTIFDLVVKLTEIAKADSALTD